MKKLITIFGLLVSIALPMHSFAKQPPHITIVLMNNSPYSFSEASISYHGNFGQHKLKCGLMRGNKKSTCTLLATDLPAAFVPTHFTVKGYNHLSGYHFKSTKWFITTTRYYAVVECKNHKTAQCTVTWEVD